MDCFAMLRRTSSHAARRLTQYLRTQVIQLSSLSQLVPDAVHEVAVDFLVNRESHLSDAILRA